MFFPVLAVGYVGFCLWFRYNEKIKNRKNRVFLAKSSFIRIWWQDFPIKKMVERGVPYGLIWVFFGVGMKFFNFFLIFFIFIYFFGIFLFFRIGVWRFYRDEYGVLSAWRFLYGGYRRVCRLRRFCDGKWGDFPSMRDSGLVGCVVAE